MFVLDTGIGLQIVHESTHLEPLVNTCVFDRNNSLTQSVNCVEPVVCWRWGFGKVKTLMLTIYPKLG